ncbi:MAG: hypothetical protein ACYDB3_11715, partial [Acidimicrobiales bacterium]
MTPDAGCITGGSDMDDESVPNTPGMPESTGHAWEPPPFPAVPAAPVQARTGRWTRVAVGLGAAAGVAAGATALAAAATSP